MNTSEINKASAQGAINVPNSNVGRPTTLLLCVCGTCGATEKIYDVGIDMILYRSNCAKCVSFEAQSLTEWFQQPGLGILNETSTNDIQSNVYRGLNWIFDDKHHGKSMLSHYVQVPSHVDEYINLMEDLAFFAHNIVTSTCIFERYAAVAKFCKMRGNRLGIFQVMLYLAGDLTASTFKQKKVDSKLIREVLATMDERENPEGWSPQAYEMKTDNVFAEMRTYLGCYEKLKQCAMYKKLHKVLLYMLTLNMLEGINITFDSLEFDKFQAKAISSTHKPGVDMVHCFLDTICFVADRGIQFFKTGDATTILHSGNSYEKWLGDANKLKRESRLMTNPEPHGINKFTFLSELKDAIEKGRAIVKFSSGLEKWEKMTVQSLLADLEIIESNEITRKSAQEPRKDPFAILLHGASNICKSQLKQIMFYHYANYFDLPSSANYMYTRCPTDEYWSGFDSTQWCIVMDDIAFLKPNNEVDPTLKELLQVKNSVPYTPPQAALEDKGRTPIRAELLIGTTNTKDLNLHAYFACPFAIARRLPYVITAKVKPEYTKCGFMADSSLIPITPEGDYMNIWSFRVSEPRPNSDDGDVDAQQTKYTIVENFDNIHDMLAWYISMAEKHNLAQSKASGAENSMRAAKVCKMCKRISLQCGCHVAQVDEIDEILGIGHQVPTQPNGIQHPDNDLLANFPLYVKIILFVVEKMAIAGLNAPIFDFNKLDTTAKVLLIAFVVRLATLSYLSFLICLLMWPIYYIYVYMFIILRFCMEYIFGFNWRYKLVYRLIGNKEICLRLLFRIAGNRVRRIHFSTRSLEMLRAYIVKPIILVAICKLISHFMGDTKKKNKPQSGIVPKAHDTEKTTYYYTDPYKLSPTDLSPQSKCTTGDILHRYVSYATARLIMKFDAMEGRLTSTTALNVKGNLWLVNKHSFKYREGTLSVLFDDVNQNVSRNIKDYRFTAKDFVELGEVEDAMLIEITALPPGRNLLPYFLVDTAIGGNYNGTYHLVSKDGIHSSKTVCSISIGKCPVFGVMGYHGKVNIPTNFGDCGSACIAEVGGAKVILGIHTSGNAREMIFIQHISQRMVQMATTRYRPQVDMGEIPHSAPGCERVLGQIHEKSSFRFVPKGTATLYGSFLGYRPKHKSRVKNTLLVEALHRRGVEPGYGKPDMTWKPWSMAANDMTKPFLNVRRDIVDMCAEAYFEDIKEGLGDKIKEIAKYTTDVALNGVDGIAYVDRMNVNTSAGNPFKKCKREFMTFDELNKITDLDPVIKQRMEDIRKCYREGRRFHPQFCGHLKDDPLPFEKIELGKTRVFTGSEMAWSIIVREYYLSIIRIIQNNPILFESMPGVVAQSTDWQAMYTHLSYFGLNRMVGGDYKLFDKSMIALFIMAAFEVMIKMGKEGGMSEEELLAMRCIAYDTAFACVDLNGDLAEMQTNPSGHPLTVIINCFVNCIYMRYAFYLCTGLHPREFKKYVHLVTYGDDNLMGVSEACPKFNHTRIAVALKAIGVTYTMADKAAESVPYIHMDECSFLKRKFVFDKDIGAIVAPLDHSSFHKMLTSYVDQGTLSPEAHSICVIETALREYFFHGKDVFEEKYRMFKEIVEELKLDLWVRDSTFPNYDAMREEFWAKDTHNFKPVLVWVC